MLRFNLLFLFVCFTLLLSCSGEDGEPGPDGSQGEQGVQGEKGEQGDKGDKGDPGEDGNANVTLYKFDGADFTSQTSIVRVVEGLTPQEVDESLWNVYLKFIFFDAPVYEHVPGVSLNDTDYKVYSIQNVSNNDLSFTIEKLSGPGLEYSEIHILRTAANNVVDNTTGRQTESPDFSKYHEVIEFYGL